MFSSKLTDNVGYIVVGACLLNVAVAPIAAIMSFKRDKFGGEFIPRTLKDE